MVKSSECVVGTQVRLDPSAMNSHAGQVGEIIHEFSYLEGVLVRFEDKRVIRTLPSLLEVVS